MPPRLKTAQPPKTKTTAHPQPATNQPKTHTHTNSQNKNKTTAPPQTNPLSNRRAVEQFAQAVHLIEGFADTLDAIPPSLTRSLSDLKELDAVLSGPLNQVHSTLDQLLNSLQNPHSFRPDQRLQLLQKIVSDIEKYNLGGQDKIRVANGTCESLSHHIRQLDTTTSLLISSLPPSLESKIPASSFPSGYPKLTGSLRSKPVGGVWSNTTQAIPDHQINSPPPITDRQVVNFNRQQQQFPSRESDLNAQSIESYPASKRARIGPTGSSSLVASSHLINHQDESRTSHQQPGPSSSKLLDQHMIFSQSSVKKHRPPQEHVGSEETDQFINVEHSINGPSGLSRQNSQLSLVASPPHPHTLPTGAKNKRPRVTSNLGGDHDNNYAALSHPVLKNNDPSPQATFQPPPIVGPKKRARKSNIIGSTRKNALDSTNPTNDDSTNATKRLMEQTQHGISSQEAGGSRTIADHIKGMNLNSIGGSTIKKSAVTGVRGANSSKNVTTTGEQPILPVPVTTKRTYTKRNGMNNGGISFSKSKKAVRKKAVGAPAPAPPPTDLVNSNPSVNNQELQVHNNHKNESNHLGQQIGRVGGPLPTFKESVRLEDVVEGARNKVRNQKLTPGILHSVPGGVLHPDESHLKREGAAAAEDEEDEDETEVERDGHDFKHPIDHRNLATSTIHHQPLSSSSKNKSTIINNLDDDYQAAKNQSNRNFQEDPTPTGHNKSLLIFKNNNHSHHHQDPNVQEVPDSSPKGSVHSNDSSEARTYCFCNGEVYGDRMVACDNAKCPIEWFHYQCAGLTEDPAGNWFCPDCQSKGFGRTSLVGGNTSSTNTSSTSIQQNNLNLNHKNNSHLQHHQQHQQGLVEETVDRRGEDGSLGRV